MCSPIKPSFFLSRFLAKSVAVGDKILVPIPAPNAVGPGNPTSPRMKTPDRAVISTRHQSDTSRHPKQDKRNQYFVSAEVRGGSLGISTVFLPCEVLREYFYRLPRTADSVDHPILYEVLRIPASAADPPSFA